MTAFQIDDMTCGHCAGAITRAVQALDPQAAVHIDLAKHRVEINSVAISASALQSAIADAGYTPVPA